MSRQQIALLEQRANTKKKSFVDLLLENKMMNSEALAVFCIETFAHPFIDLRAIDPDCLPEKIIDLQRQKELCIIPLAKRGNKLSVAISDPSNAQVLEQIKHHTQLSVIPIIVDHTALLDLLARQTKCTEQQNAAHVHNDANSKIRDNSTSSSMRTNEADDAPVVDFLHKLLTDAINMGASDLHFEPFETCYRIRFRIDGQLRDIASPPYPSKTDWHRASRFSPVSTSPKNVSPRMDACN